MINIENKPSKQHQDVYRDTGGELTRKVESRKESERASWRRLGCLEISPPSRLLNLRAQLLELGIGKRLERGEFPENKQFGQALGKWWIPVRSLNMAQGKYDGRGCERK